MDDEPTCFSHAIKHSHGRQVMSEEFRAFLKNDTWELQPHTLVMNVEGVSISTKLI